VRGHAGPKTLAVATSSVGDQNQVNPMLKKEIIKHIPHLVVKNKTIIRERQRYISYSVDKFLLLISFTEMCNSLNA